MRNFHKLGGLILAITITASAVAAQNYGLPRFGKNESYSKVRVKLLKAGWKPFRSPDADECSDGDRRCAGRPEMQSCAGTGLAPCRFLWKRRGKTVVIFTAGENTIYNGYEFEK